MDQRMALEWVSDNIAYFGTLLSFLLITFFESPSDTNFLLYPLKFRWRSDQSHAFRRVEWSDLNGFPNAGLRR